MRRVLQRMLFIVAAALLAWCGFVLADTWNFQKSERSKLDQLLAERQPASNQPVPLADSGLIGLMKIPRLGLSVIVIEGTDSTTLRHAAGHIAGTALPGQPGNVGIAGHRDTFFQSLQNIRQNDTITFTTLLGDYQYRVMSTQIVTPYDVSVLNPGANEILTLVTCYPFDFVGAAPNRFIVRAIRLVLPNPTASANNGQPPG